MEGFNGHGCPSMDAVGGETMGLGIAASHDLLLVLQIFSSPLPVLKSYALVRYKDTRPVGSAEKQTSKDQDKQETRKKRRSYERIQIDYPIRPSALGVREPSRERLLR